MNNDSNLAVQIRAEDGQLKPGMDQAAQAVEQSAQKMRDSFARLSDDVKGHMTRVHESVKAANDGIYGSFSSLTGVFGKVNGALAAIGAVLAGGAAFKAGIEESKKFTGEANKLAKALGISATEASTLNVALGDIYSGAEEFVGASQMLSRQLRTNEDALNSMGLTTRDANGEYRNMKDIMFDAIKVLNGYKEGTDRTLAMQTMFGRGAAEAGALLRLNNEVIEEARKKQESLGLVVGKENVEALKQYKAAMNDAGDVVSAVKKAVGDALMPVLTKLATWFSDIGPAAVTVIKGAIGGLTAAFWALKNGVVVLWETINAMVVTVAEPIRALAEAIYKAMTGDFSGAKDALKSVPGNIADAWKGAFKEIANSSQETSEKIANLFSRPTDAAAKKATGKSYVDPKEKEDKKAAEKTRMPEWEAILAEQKTAYMRSHDMYEMSLDDEKKYWDNLLATLNKGDKEYGAVRKKSADLELQILKKKAQEGRAIAQEEISAWRSSALDGVAAEQQVAQQRRDLGQITNAELFQMELQFENERFEINRKALDERLSLMEKDPNMNPVEYKKLKDQILEIERKHELDLQAIKNKVQLDDAKPMLTMFNSMEQGFANAITGMLTRAQTFKQALGSLWQQSFAIFTQEMIAKPLAQMAIRVIRETALYKMLFGAQVTTQAAASTTVVGTKAAEATAVVSANAAEAASGAAASQAPIPFVGPAMAAAAFAAVMAMVMGAKSNIKSARGGYDIPGGVNPLTQLHESEMVLPKEHADVIRGLAANGGGGGAPVNVTIHALDATSVRDYFKRNSHTLAPGLRNLARNFTSTKG